MREKIGLHCEVISGYAFSTSDWKEEGIPVVKIGNISNGEDILCNDQMQYVEETFLDKLDEKYHISKGDVLISLTGSHINQPNSMVGRCCRSLTEKKYLLNQRAGKVLPFENTNKNYLYYLLSTKAIKYDIANRAYGGANQVNVSPKDIKKIKWDFPTIDIQEKISNILSTYDELIENNNKRIKLLEQMAENLYKEWFVRFRFLNHESTKFKDGIPVGWKIQQAQSIFDITIGRTPDRKQFDYFTNNENDALWVSISDMKDNMFITKSFEYLTDEAINKVNMPMVEADTILLSFKLSVGRVSITTKLSCTNEAIAHFKTNDKDLLEYTYLYLKLFNYQNLGNTSAIGNAVNSTIIKKMKFILPNRDLLEMFHNSAKDIFTEIKNLKYSNENLIKQRDLLLPRLMSGKLEV